MKDDRAIVYPSMWKKMMVFGIPRDYALFCLLLAALGPLITTFLDVGVLGIIGGFLVFAGLYVYGLIRGHSDPEFFSVVVNRITKLGTTKGRYKGNEYIP